MMCATPPSSCFAMCVILGNMPATCPRTRKENRTSMVYVDRSYRRTTRPPCCHHVKLDRIGWCPCSCVLWGWGLQTVSHRSWAAHVDGASHTPHNTTIHGMVSSSACMISRCVCTWLSTAENSDSFSRLSATSHSKDIQKVKIICGLHTSAVVVALGGAL